MFDELAQFTSEEGRVSSEAVVAQLGERQTEDLKVPGSIPGRGA